MYEPGGTRTRCKQAVAVQKCIAAACEPHCASCWLLPVGKQCDTEQYSYGYLILLLTCQSATNLLSLSACLLTINNE